MIRSFIKKIETFLNRPNYSSVDSYTYDNQIKKLLFNIEKDIKKKTNIKLGNYMQFIKSDSDYFLKQKIKNNIKSIIKKNLEEMLILTEDSYLNRKENLNKLNEQGFFKSETFDFSQTEIESLNNFLKTLNRYPGHIISNTNKANKKNLKNSVYHTFHPKDILKNKIIQKRLFDEEFLLLAENYFGTIPTCITINIYEQKKKLAMFDYVPQFFHRDHHDLQLMTYFSFLSDTTSEDGAHCYIKYSHDYNQLEKNLSDFDKKNIHKKGKKILDYFQLDKNGYGHEELLELLSHLKVNLYGKKGTSFVTDNTGIHKAIAPLTSNRLIFWVSFGIYNKENIARLPLRVKASELDMLNKESKNFTKLKYVYRNYIDFDF